MKYCDFIYQTIRGKNNIEWNYYGDRLNTKNILGTDASSNFISDYFSNGQKFLPMILETNAADEFIDEYFRAGQKELLLFRNIDRKYQLPPERATHTVSGFFLGLLIEKCLMQNKSLCINRDNLFPFPYLWFLTFLYHDYGYCITEKNDGPIRFPQHAPIKYLPNLNGKLQHEYTAMHEIKRKLKITLSPFSQFRTFSVVSNHYHNIARNLLTELTNNDNLISKNAKLYLSNGSIIEKTQYKSCTITRYMNYRINEFKAVDHGIVGGFLFFDRLLKNYMIAYEQTQKEWYRDKTQLEDFYYNGRHFCMEQIPIFSYIADCIMSHNIFKQSDDEEARRLYEIYGLNELFKENFKKITFQSNPLLYILCVADTLEPIKTYQKDSSNELTATAISKALQIDYSISDMSLTFSSSSPKIDISLLHKKAMDLMDWTSAKCSKLIDGSFTVYL